jgi:glyoxylase-like metal-dependent hydrolase (beta-lactamase superfamily II)
MRITPIHPGIVRITLPLAGKKPGPVQVYLFQGKANTVLLDTGTYLSSRVLKSALGRLGLGYQDLDGIVLTHGHVDHCGAVRTIVRQNAKGVKVCAHHDEIPAIKAGFDAPPHVYARFLALSGTPLAYRWAIGAMLRSFQMLAQGCDVDRALQDGDHLALGDHEATVVATPGHTRGSICLFLEKEGLLFSGDHILNHITPNALPMLEKELALPLRQSQKEYFDSLQIVAELAPTAVHPAHGGRITDFNAIHHLYQRCFKERQNALLAILDGHLPESIYGVARKLFPRLGGQSFLLDLYLAIAETYSHLQVLAVDGRVRMEMKDRVLRVLTSH